MANFTHSHWNWQSSPNNFVNIVDNDIEIKSPKEICLREQLGDLDENIYNVQVSRRKGDVG